MKVYLVITVFQGVFDAVVPYTSEEWADAYIDKLKAEKFDPDELQIVKQCVDVDVPTS